MTKMFSLKLAAVAGLASLMGALAPAQAAGTSEMVSMCTQAAVSENIIAADQYQAKMKRVNGASLKKLTIEMTPLNGDGAAIMVLCKVRRGAVVDVTVQ